MTLTAPVAHDHPAGGSHCDPGCPAWEDDGTWTAQTGHPPIVIRLAGRTLRGLADLITGFDAELGPNWPNIIRKQFRRRQIDQRNMARLMRIRDRRRERRIRRGVQRETRRSV